MSRASRGPASRTRPLNRPGAPREADRIKAPRAGWAKPATAVRTLWRSGPLPVPLAGVAAGLWAALTGLIVTVVLTLVVWIFAAGESASDTALRVGADVWLAGHAIPFRIDDGVWSLMPWMWTVLPGITVWAAGRWLAHRAAIAFVKSAAVAAGTLAGTYALIALLAALYGTLSGAGALPLRAVLHAGLLAFLVSFSAILWRAALARDVMRRAWVFARPAFGGLAVLVVGAAMGLAVALVASYGAIAATIEQLGPGLVGGIALFAGWLGYLPTALFWTLSYAVGAGVSVAGATVTPLAGLGERIDVLGLNLVPATALPAWLLGVLVPVAAGVVLNRLAGGAGSRRAWLQDRAVALAVLLILIDLWWFISTGRMGQGRLGLLGPPPLVIPLLLAAVVLGLAGDELVRWGLRWWQGRRAAVAADEPEPVDEDVSA